MAKRKVNDENNMLFLRPLQKQDFESFCSAVDAFMGDAPAWDFAFQFDRETSFTLYVETVQSWENGMEGFVPCTYLVAVVRDQIVGRVSIRHELNDFLREYGGHVGYGVIPSERGKGYATEILRQALDICAEMKLRKIMISCDVDNLASKKVIEKNGGVFERETELDSVDTQKLIYSIETDE